jgi:hypothetical protein
MKYFIFLFFFVLQLVGFAQPKDQPLAVVASTQNNILYRNISNPISINVPGYYAKDFIVKTSVGKIENINGTSYYNLNTGLCSEKLVKITVYLKKFKGKQKCVGEQNFALRNYPKPSLQLGPIDNDGFVSYQKLNGSNGIFAIDRCYSINGLAYTVTEFVVKHKHKDGSISIFKVPNSNLLTEEIKESFKKAEDGDTIMLYDVTVNGPNGIEKLPDELIFIVKEI